MLPIVLLSACASPLDAALADTTAPVARMLVGDDVALAAGEEQVVEADGFVTIVGEVADEDGGVRFIRLGGTVSAWCEGTDVIHRRYTDVRVEWDADLAEDAAPTALAQAEYGLDVGSFGCEADERFLGVTATFDVLGGNLAGATAEGGVVHVEHSP